MEFNTAYLADPNKVQETEEGDKDKQIDSENKENWSKTEGMNEIAEDTEAGPEDKTEDESEGLPEGTLAWALALLAEVESMKKKMLGNEYEESNSKGENQFSKKFQIALATVQNVPSTHGIRQNLRETCAFLMLSC